MEAISTNNRFALSENTLKWIAIICMTVDHIAWAFVPYVSGLGFAMHLVGRITAPVMCFCIAEGYFHTKNVRRYAVRLAVFALISWPAYSYQSTGTPFTLNLGMIWTLLLGLLALWACDKLENRLFSILIVFGCVALSFLGDWPIFGVLYILAFGLNRGRFGHIVIWFALITLPMTVGALLFSAFRNGSLPVGWWADLMQFGVLLALPLLYCYSGKRGGPVNSRAAAAVKYIFYWYYPLHLLVIGLLQHVVFPNYVL